MNTPKTAGSVGVVQKPTPSVWFTQCMAELDMIVENHGVVTKQSLTEVRAGRHAAHEAQLRNHGRAR